MNSHESIINSTILTIDDHLLGLTVHILISCHLACVLATQLYGGVGDTNRPMLHQRVGRRHVVQVHPTLQHTDAGWRLVLHPLVHRHGVVEEPADGQQADVVAVVAQVILAVEDRCSVGVVLDGGRYVELSDVHAV